MSRIFVSIRNSKTCRSWVKKVHSVDLTQKGGWAIEGDFVARTEGRFSVADVNETFGHLYEDDVTAPGDIYLVSYQGGSWKNQERWAALVRVTEASTTDSGSGRSYGLLGVEGGKIIFFATDYAPQDAMNRLRELGVILDAETRAKAKNPIYACALAYSRFSADAPALPPLPEGWEWGPAVSGIQFLRRAGHAELVFPTQPFLPADFLREQAERLRALAAVAETAAEMAETAEEVADAEA